MIEYELITGYSYDKLMGTVNNLALQGYRFISMSNIADNDGNCFYTIMMQRTLKVYATVIIKGEKFTIRKVDHMNRVVQVSPQHEDTELDDCPKYQFSDIEFYEE